MTLVLNDGTTPDLEVKTLGEMDGNVVHLAVEVDTGDLPGGGGLLDISVSLSDFLDAARYVLTNTDLAGDDDLRVEFRHWVQASVIGAGRNPGAHRIAQAEPGQGGLVKCRHWRVVSNEGGGISFSASDGDRQATEAAAAAEEWCRFVGADRCHVEEWVQTYFVGESDWRRVDPA